MSTVGLLAVGLMGLPGCAPTPSAVLVEEQAIPPEPVRIEKPTAQVQPECGARTRAGSPRLMPASVDWLGRVSLPQMMNSPLWTVAEAQLQRDGDWIALEAALAGCGIPLEAMEDLTVGVASGSEDFVALLSAQGIGGRETSECLIRGLWTVFREEGEAPPQVRVMDVAGDPPLARIDLDEEGSYYLLSEHHIALVSAGLRDEFERMSRCEGPSTVDLNLSEALSAIDGTAPLWFVAKLDGGQAESLGGELATLSRVAVNLYAGAELHMDAEFGFRDEEGAAAFAELIEESLPMASAFLPGLEQAVARTVIDHRPYRVGLHFGMDASELAVFVGILNQ